MGGIRFLVILLMVLSSCAGNNARSENHLSFTEKIAQLEESGRYLKPSGMPEPKIITLPSTNGVGAIDITAEVSFVQQKPISLDVLRVQISQLSSGVYELSSMGLQPVFLADDIVSYNRDAQLVKMTAVSMKKIKSYDIGIHGLNTIIVNNGQLGLQLALVPEMSSVGRSVDPRLTITYRFSSSGADHPVKINEVWGLTVGDEGRDTTANSELSAIIQLWIADR